MIRFGPTPGSRKHASQPGGVESTRSNRVNSVRVQVKQQQVNCGSGQDSGQVNFGQRLRFGSNSVKVSSKWSHGSVQVLLGLVTRRFGSYLRVVSTRSTHS
ncbi:hypothetical protein Hanom_Chr13g01208021 [Helianthus anomalus]